MIKSITTSRSSPVSVNLVSVFEHLAHLYLLTQWKSLQFLDKVRAHRLLTGCFVLYPRLFWVHSCAHSSACIYVYAHIHVLLPRLRGHFAEFLQLGLGFRVFVHLCRFGVRFFLHEVFITRMRIFACSFSFIVHICKVLNRMLMLSICSCKVLMHSFIYYYLLIWILDSVYVGYSLVYIHWGFINSLCSCLESLGSHHPRMSKLCICSLLWVPRKSCGWGFYASSSMCCLNGPTFLSRPMSQWTLLQELTMWSAIFFSDICLWCNDCDGFTSI